MDLVEILKWVGDNGSNNGDYLSSLIGGIGLVVAAGLLYWSYRKNQDKLLFSNNGLPEELQNPSPKPYVGEETLESYL